MNLMLQLLSDNHVILHKQYQECVNIILDINSQP